jgi:hypothetical protein
MVFAKNINDKKEKKEGGCVMFRRIFFVTILGIFLGGCTSTKMRPRPPQKVLVKVMAAEPAKADLKTGDPIKKSIQVPNPEGRLSRISFISKDKAFIKLFSGLTVSDVTMLRNDLPKVAEPIISSIKAESEKAMAKNIHPILLTSPTLRRHMKKNPRVFCPIPSRIVPKRVLERHDV